MFGRRNKEVENLTKQVTTLERSRDSLQERVHQLRVEKRDFELQKKMEIEDIEHMVKIKEERLDIQFDKKVVALERKKDEEVLTIKNQYRDKVEKFLEAGRKELMDMYKQILSRLPNIDVALKGKV